MSFFRCRCSLCGTIWNVHTHVGASSEAIFESDIARYLVAGRIDECPTPGCYGLLVDQMLVDETAEGDIIRVDGEPDYPGLN